MMVTRDATKVTPQSLDALRAQGFSDEDILDAVEITGFFNYYARMADALGVEPESHWAEG
jgi:alkylhydroperoxidase family enzyme